MQTILKTAEQLRSLKPLSSSVRSCEGRADFQNNPQPTASSRCVLSVPRGSKIQSLRNTSNLFRARVSARSRALLRSPRGLQPNINSPAQVTCRFVNVPLPDFTPPDPVSAPQPKHTPFQISVARHNTYSYNRQRITQEKK
jgi:hypothetical protein